MILRHSLYLYPAQYLEIYENKDLDHERPKGKPIYKGLYRDLPDEILDGYELIFDTISIKDPNLTIVEVFKP